MKSYLFRASSILFALALLVFVSLSGTAQQSPRQQQQQVEQQERPILELPVQQIDAELLRVRIPQCPKHPVVQMHDVADNFTPPGTAGTLSPALASYLQSHQITPKGYDDKRVNMIFADSFKLDSCKVCYATLEFGVRHYADIWSNDSITVGGAPFNPVGLRVLSAPIWSPPLQSPVNLTTQLNNYIFGNNVSFLDVIAQDDTDFDFMKLTVWYY